MSKKKSATWTEFQGGVEGALQGFATSIGPLLMFIGLFGPQGVVAGFWATLITASVVHALSLLLPSQKALIPSARVASLSVFVALVLKLAQTAAGTTASGGYVSLEHLRIGLAAGSLMFLLACLLVVIAGLMKWGHIFKMIPSPVSVGITNGTALLLVWLAIRQVQSSALTSTTTAICMMAVYLAWPKLARFTKHALLVPPVAVAILTGFLMAWLFGQSPAASQGTSYTDSWQWTSLLLWPQLSDQKMGQLFAVGLPGALTLALVMTLETFTVAGVMESRFGVRVDPNRELVALGVSNAASALLGGVPCTASPVRSIPSWTAGGRGWLASIVCLVLTVTLILGLSPWLLALPTSVIAGLFLVQAYLMTDKPFVQRLKELLRERKLRPSSTQDLGFWIAFAITVVAAVGGLIWACALGIGLSCLLVLRRVSVDLAAQWAYLDQYSSRRVRSPLEIASLYSLHRNVGVLRLTGHLFFGNSVRLTQLLDELHADATCAIIDVSQVSDVDPSGLDALSVLIRALAARPLTVVMTGQPRSRAKDPLGLLASAQNIRLCVDLDRGLELAEDLILAKAGTTKPGQQRRALAQNSLLLGMTEDEKTAALMFGDVRQVNKGEALFKRDEPADGVWMIESGKVSIVSNMFRTGVRLSTFGPGQFVGEMAFVDGGKRSATAVADTDVRALKLNQQAFATLQQQQPEAALHIIRNIARELSSRVRGTSAMLTDTSQTEAVTWANSSLSPMSRF